MSFEINSDVKITGNTEFHGYNDHNLNESRKFVIETTSNTSFPAATPSGRPLFCTVERNSRAPGIWIVIDSQWVYLREATHLNGYDLDWIRNRANHTGTQLADTISNFNAAVQANRLDQMAAPTANVSMNGRRITNLANPVDDQDAINYGFLRSKLQGLNTKEIVKVATTQNITLSGTQTIDGTALAVDDRVLVKNQTNAQFNGIYLVKSSTWQRASDADTWNKLVSAYVFVERGTANADSGWLCTIDYDAGTLETNDITWIQFTGAGEITASNGLQKVGNDIQTKLDTQSMYVITGNNLAVKAEPEGGIKRSTHGIMLHVDYDSLFFNSADSYKTTVRLKPDGAITKGPTGLAVAVDNSTIEIVDNQLRAKAGGIARKHVATYTGNGTTTNFTVTHNFNTRDVAVVVRRHSDYKEIYPVNLSITDNMTQVQFKPAPANGFVFSITVIG